MTVTLSGSMLRAFAICMNRQDKLFHWVTYKVIGVQWGHVARWMVLW